MNIKFDGVGKFIFPKYPCWSSQLNVKSNVWYPQVYSIEGVWANRGVCAKLHKRRHLVVECHLPIVLWNGSKLESMWHKCYWKELANLPHGQELTNDYRKKKATFSYLLKLSSLCRIGLALTIVQPMTSGPCSLGWHVKYLSTAVLHSAWNVYWSY